MRVVGSFKLAACLAAASTLLVAGLVIAPGSKGPSHAAGTPLPPSPPAPAGAQFAPAARVAPNIVMILVDDMALSDLANMPNVKALLGDGGTTFDRAISPYPLCCPARATILTGRYSHNHGVQGNLLPLGGFPRFNDKHALPVWLQNSGYRTMMVGKYLNLYDTRPRYVPPGWDSWGGLARRVYNYLDWKVNRNGRVSAPANRYQTTALTNMAVGRIRSAAPKLKPFFLWASYMAPHTGSPHEADDVVRFSPYVEPRFQGSFDGVRPERGPSFNEDDVSDKPANLRDNPPVDVQEMNDHWQQRQEALMSVDEGVGKIVSQLRASRELARTVIAFTSDNGFLLGEHRLLGKVLPYEESIRVPLLIRGPGFPAGLHVQQQASLADLVPTFLKTARGRATRSVDGAALQNLAANPRIWAGRPIVVEASPAPRELAAGAPMDRRNRSYVGIRTAANQLYVRYATGEREYYDMRTDPWQVRNLYGTPSAQAEIDRLDRLLKRYQNCSGVSCRTGS